MSVTSEKINVLIGISTGFVTKIITGELAAAVIVAFFTGAAAYAGQIVVKSIHKKLTKSDTSSKDE